MLLLIIRKDRVQLTLHLNQMLCAYYQFEIPRIEMMGRWFSVGKYLMSLFSFSNWNHDEIIQERKITHVEWQKNDKSWSYRFKAYTSSSTLVRTDKEIALENDLRPRPWHKNAILPESKILEKERESISVSPTVDDVDDDYDGDGSGHSGGGGAGNT